MVWQPTHNGLQALYSSFFNIYVQTIVFTLPNSEKQKEKTLSKNSNFFDESVILSLILFCLTWLKLVFVKSCSEFFSIPCTLRLLRLQFWRHLPEMFRSFLFSVCLPFLYFSQVTSRLFVNVPFDFFRVVVIHNKRCFDNVSVSNLTTVRLLNLPLAVWGFTSGEFFEIWSLLSIIEYSDFSFKFLP